MFVPSNRFSGHLRPSLALMAAIFAVVLVLLLPISGSSQIRLHDSAKDDLAKKTRDAYAEFTKEDNTVFDKMISNTLALKSATLTHLMDLNSQARRDTINLIPVSSWQKLRDIYVPQTQEQFLTAYNGSRLIMNLQGATDLKKALDQAKAELAARTDAKKKKSDELNVEEPKLQDLKNSLEAIKNQIVTSPKPVKSLSDFPAQWDNLKNIWKSVSEVKEWLEAAEKASHAPGLQLTILDLGVQHQQFVVERLKLQLEEEQAAEARAARIEHHLELVLGPDAEMVNGRPKAGLFGQIYRALTINAPKTEDLRYPFVTDETEQVIQTIGKLAVLAEKETDGQPLVATMKLRDLMDVLSRYVTLVGYHQYVLLAEMIEAGVDKNLYAIRLSAINTKEREMLVSHGLEGLAAYHAGGLKPEEIANFFRAAQSIAVGVLAGRVQ